MPRVSRMETANSIPDELLRLQLQNIPGLESSIHG